MADYQIKNPVKMTKDVVSFVPGVGEIVDGKLANAPEDLENVNLQKFGGQQPPQQPPVPAAPAASTPEPHNDSAATTSAPQTPHAGGASSVVASAQGEQTANTNKENN